MISFFWGGPWGPQNNYISREKRARALPLRLKWVIRPQLSLIVPIWDPVGPDNAENAHFHKAHDCDQRMFARGPLPIAHYPLAIAGTGRLHGASESAALALGKSWRAESTPTVRLCPFQYCRSLTPLKSPPAGPAHSARPTQNQLGVNFGNFHNCFQKKLKF